MEKEEQNTASRVARKLELTIGERKSDSRFYELELREQGHTTSNVSTGITGPAIVLNQNQPVEISVSNKIKEATSIHWHGIELESYYDGVPEWGGIGEKRTPAVNPGEAFVVKMTPPRAGTFIYHTHWHDDAQLTNGIHGPLIVMSPGKAFDPANDKIFLFSQAPAEPFGGVLLMNGTPQPPSMQLKTGTKYRFRFINITPSIATLRVSMRQAGVPTQWRILAKDAVDLPPAAAKMKLADQLVSVGETYDFEYEAASPQELTLEGLNPGDMRRAIQNLLFTDPAK